MDHLGALVADRFRSKLIENRGEKPLERDIRVVEMDGLLLRRGGDLQVAAEDGGLSDTDLTGHDNDAFSFLHAV